MQRPADQNDRDRRSGELRSLSDGRREGGLHPGQLAAGTRLQDWTGMLNGELGKEDEWVQVEVQGAGGAAPLLALWRTRGPDIDLQLVCAQQLALDSPYSPPLVPLSLPSYGIYRP